MHPNGYTERDGKGMWGVVALTFANKLLGHP